MIKLFTAPELDYRGGQVANLLYWAECTLADTATDVETRLAGCAARLAFEFHLAELCRQHGPPKGIRWHSFEIRLLKAGVFTMGQYRDCRRIARLAHRAVHGKPWTEGDARKLLDRVNEFMLKEM